MIRALLLSIGQLGDRAILVVIGKVLAVTLAVFALLAAGLWWGAASVAAAQGWSAAGGMAAAAVAAVAAVAAIAGAWLLFRIVAIAVMGLFADGVVEAVERRHYPDAFGAARAPSLVLSLGLALASAGRALLFNLIALPLYLILAITGIGTVLLFAAVNALLLGRDLGEMVAARHMPPEAVRGWLETTRWPRFALGLVVTGLFVVPVVNLLAPILGAAMATHLFHGRRR